MGASVRYDGGHKRHALVTEVLSHGFEFVAVCPEVAMGLDVPRPALRLRHTHAGVRLYDSRHSTVDHTAAATESASAVIQGLPAIYGAILKKDSPSCGVHRVKVYHENNVVERNGIGIFACTLLSNDPLLPVEEEGRLNDDGIRESFIERIYAYYDWHQLVRSGLTIAKLMAFHRDHKFLIMSRPAVRYNDLGKLLANTEGASPRTVGAQYIERLMSVLKIAPTRRARTNMLYHMLGYLKRSVGPDDKRALVESLEQYRLGFTPLGVPLSLLKDYFRRFPHEYVQRQRLMKPFPLPFGMFQSV